MDMNGRSYIELTAELNDRLCDFGWTAMKVGSQTKGQKNICDIVAFRNGEIRFIAVEKMAGGNSKKQVGDKIRDLKEIKSKSKPLAPAMNTNYEWVLAVYMQSEDCWYGFKDDKPTVKASELSKRLVKVI